MHSTGSPTLLELNSQVVSAALGNYQKAAQAQQLIRDGSEASNRSGCNATHHVRPGRNLTAALTVQTDLCLPLWVGFTTGTYCQYASVDPSHLAKVPDGVDIKTAGGVPLVGLTAWQALTEGQPHQGQRVLVLAASGGGWGTLGAAALSVQSLNCRAHCCLVGVCCAFVGAAS